GVVPPELALGPSLALDAEAALDRILARCAREPACHERFGDPAAAYRNLLGSLAASDVPVSLADPTSGEPIELGFGAMHLATVLRLSSYSADYAARLPLSLHAAARERNFEPLATLFLLLTRSLDSQLAFG